MGLVDPRRSVSFLHLFFICTLICVFNYQESRGKNPYFKTHISVWSETLDGPQSPEQLSMSPTHVELRKERTMTGPWESHGIPVGRKDPFLLQINIF